MFEQTLLVLTSGMDNHPLLRSSLNDCSSDPIRLRIKTVDSVEAAKACLETNEIDVVLLDLENRGPDQIRALSGAIESFAPVPVVVWTSAKDAELARDMRSLGATACLDDSMSSSDLIREIFFSVAGTRRFQALHQQHTETAVTLEAIADAVICTNSRAELTFLNSAAYRLLNFPTGEVLGHPVTDVMSLQDAASREPVVHPVHRVIATGQISRLPAGTVLIRQDRSEIRIEDSCSPVIGDSGALQGVVMVFHDTTEAYEMQAQVDYLAWHDFLTGLPNRFAIQKRLDQTFAHAAAHHQRVPVLYLDLDKFKLINDTLGHSAGDKLLVSVSDRLRSCFRLIDLVGRQGGDEFIVVMASGSSIDDAVVAAARIIETLGKPHQINGSEVRIGCSVGIALYPEHGSDVEIILHHADIALQSVKTDGRNGWRVFAHELHAEKLERQLMEDGLRTALKTGSFKLFYQPKIRLADGKVSGCEALLRWKHPEWGWIAPARFIPCAEACGLIGLLGRWVFDEAIRQAKAWAKDGIPFGSIAINISAEELRHPEFIENIRARLESSGIDPDLLQFELTESVLMHDIDYAGNCLKQLKELGLSLAIDDFGTGYSSLSYLADFPIDVLKIDRSFIHGINRAGTRQQALLHAILTLAKSLSLLVVAEGIETIEEENFLLHTGCEVGQGYYYGEPMNAAMFEKFLAFREQGRMMIGAPG